MPFTDIAPPKAAKTASGTGISMGLRFSKSRGGVARITINTAMQEFIFGGPIHGQRFHAQAGRGADEGLLRLVKTDDGQIEAKAGVKGSASLSMATWDLLPKDARPSASCAVKSRPSNVEVILSLPTWCRPSGVDGKISAQHRLKPIPRAQK